MKYKQTLTAGALAVTGALAFGGLNAYAAEVTVTTFDDLRTCLAVNDNVCKLGADLISSSEESITAPKDINVQLDLAGHTIGSNSESVTNLTVVYEGELTINDSSNKDGKLYGHIETPALTTSRGKLIINGGTFYGDIDDTLSHPGDIIVNDGVFNATLTISAGTLYIDGGVFNKSVTSNFNSQMTVKKGTFNGSLTADSANATIIENGTFNDGAYLGLSKNSKIKISGGVFKNFSSRSTYVEGTSVEVSGGTFQTASTFNVQKLAISGGTFICAGTKATDTTQIRYENIDDQTYTITGGEFLRTDNKPGHVLLVSTVVEPTESMIRGLFKDSVLTGTTIELGKKVLSTYYTYINRGEPTNDDTDTSSSSSDSDKSSNDEAPTVKVPDTGNNTMNGDSAGALSLAVIVFAALVGSGILGSIIYLGTRKKIVFGKK